jgi:DNA-binding MarR family transcriptional regulator
MKTMPNVPAPTRAECADLAARLRVSVWRAARRMRRESAPGISPTLHAALFTIESRGPLTAGQLADYEQVRKPTVTRTLAALLQQGLITRTPDPLDGRITWLQVTPAGSRLLQGARRRTDEFLSKRLTRLTPQERAVLDEAVSILDRLSGGEEP